MNYRAPYWLPGGHMQTIWSALCSHAVSGEAVSYRRERWDTPDGDFIDVDRLDGSTEAAPQLVLFHGLEGGSRSHYALAFAQSARQLGWAFAVPHFRGCSGEINRNPRAYHSGDYEEVDWILRKMRAERQGPLVAAGVSLGGNALMRWAAESGGSAAKVVCAVASVCAPLDLMASGAAMGQGLNQQIYTRMFLQTMKPKAMKKLAQYPKLFDAERLMAARNLYEFDNLFTAPLHGFRDTVDYWSRASAKPMLSQIQIPALALNAQNDPFVPAPSLPNPQDAGPWVTLWQPQTGGHVGFAAGKFPGHLADMPRQVLSWLEKQGGLDG